MTASRLPAVLTPYPPAPKAVRSRARAAGWRIRRALVPHLITEPVADPWIRAVLVLIDEEVSEIMRAVDGMAPAPNRGEVYDSDAANDALPDIPT